VIAVIYSFYINIGVAVQKIVKNFVPIKPKEYVGEDQWTELLEVFRK